MLPRRAPWEQEEPHGTLRLLTGPCEQLAVLQGLPRGPRFLPPREVLGGLVTCDGGC